MEPYELAIGQKAFTDAEIEHVRSVEAMRDIFSGNHRRYFYQQDRTQHAFKAIGPNARKVLYIAENLPGMCTLKHADLLLGEPVAIEPPKDLADNDQVREAIRRLSAQSHIDAALHEVAVTAGWAGRAYLQAIARNGRVRLEPVDPAMVFARYEPGGREMIGAAIKQQLTLAGKTYVRIADHQPGVIRQRLYELDRRGKVAGQAPLDLIRPGLEKEMPTGIDSLTIVEIRNYTYGGLGASDYTGSEPLIDEIDNRLTQISRILDVHGDPAMVALESLFDANGQLNISGRAIAAQTMEKGDPVKYLTWDAKLADCAAQLDRVMHAFLRQQEVSPVLIGLGGETSADGWKKLKLQIGPTLARVNRKELHAAPAFADAIRVAMELENKVALGIRYPVAPVTLTFSDGIPVDETEQMQVVTGYYSGGLMSRELALTKIHNDRAVVDAEMDRLDAQDRASLPTAFRDGRLEEAAHDHG